MRHTNRLGLNILVSLVLLLGVVLSINEVSAWNDNSLGNFSSFGNSNTTTITYGVYGLDATPNNVTQNFSINFYGKINYISLYACSESGSDITNISIGTTQKGKEILNTSLSISCSCSAGGYCWNNVTINKEIDNGTYWLFISKDSGIGRISMTAGNTYIGGQACPAESGTGCSGYSNYDFSFIMNYNLKIENFTFYTTADGPKSYTRYLKVPSGSLLSKAYLNLSGWETGFYPRSPAIKIGNIANAWNYTGNFNMLNNRTYNLANAVNSYLSTCTYSDGYCYVPFNFTTGAFESLLQISDFYFDSEGVGINQVLFNRTTYETSAETFSINLTYDNNIYTSIKANLSYNGTIYEGTKSGSGSNVLFTKSMDMPSWTVSNNNTLYWIIYLTNSTGTYQYNSTFQNQTVKPIQLGLCNSTLNITYLNFTFNDEATNLNMTSKADLLTWTYYLGSGTEYKSFLFSNSTANSNYPFCFNQPDKTLNGNINFQYSNTGYYQRQFTYILPLTNSSLNKLLYLLGSGDGIYSTIVTQTIAYSPISGVTVQVERQFNGIWTLLTQGTTDSAGAVTFFLNPNYQHRFTATKTGYSSVTATAFPTQAQYTIILGQGTGNATYTSIFEGITYNLYPKLDMLNKNTSYNVTLNLTSSKCNLVRYKTELKLLNGTIITSNEGFNACGSELMITFNTNDYDYLYLYYYIDIGTGYYQLDPSIFNIANLYEGEGSLNKAFRNLLNNRTDVKDRYGQLWWTFFLTFLILSSFTYFTGMELSNPGINLILILFYVVFLSYAGLLTMDFGSGVDPWFSKYGLAILAFCMAGGFMLRRLE